MKLKVANTIIFLIVLIASGCAKKILIKYAEPEAVKECEENFYRQFHSLVSDQEEKELKNIKTISECREFQDRFWQIRDTDPTTPQNEYKEEKEKLASEIKNEILFSNQGTVGFLFKNNGDFNGDPGKVYMLHGMPDYTETLDHGYTYVNLMLWVYSDEEGKHKYRFLFYQKNGLNNYVLLHQNFDIFYTLQEINKSSLTNSPSDVYYELVRENQLFLYSMINFSDYPSLSQDKALRPPRPASEIAKELAPQIIGNEPEKKEIVISNNFGSLLPAELSYEFDSENLIVKVAIKHENLDWIIKNNELMAELFVRIDIWGKNNKFQAERSLGIISTEEKIKEKRSTFVFESLPIELHEQPEKISVYIKNNNKYNAWVEEIKK